MNLEAVQTKHLNQIEDLAKQLLLVLSNSEWDDHALSQELTVLAIESSNERQLRSKSDADQQAKDASSRLNTWENEDGNTNVETPGRPLNRLRGDIRPRRYGHPWN